MNSKIENFLSELSKFKQPVAISDIATHLDSKVTDRTLRRWLNTLIEEQLVLSFGEKKSRKYILSEKGFQKALSLQEKTIEHPNHLFFSDSSLEILQKIKTPIFSRDPCSYNANWLQNYIPNKSFYLPENLRTQMLKNSLAILDKLTADTYTKKIFNRLLIDLSYNSSRLEGNTYSLLETEKLVLEGRAADEKLDAEKLMILNHKEAIKYLVAGINRIELSIDNIKTMHYLLSENLVSAEYSGKVRDDIVRITATTYIPLEDRQRLENYLQIIADKAIQIHDPFEQSFFLLAHISYLQPFIDVNKRTARLCANIPLIQNNLAPFSFNDINKDDYISAILTIYEFNDPGPLAELYAWSYARSCKNYKVTAESMGINEFRVRYRSLRKQLIGNIIRGCLTGKELENSIQEFARTKIEATDQEQFISDVQEDLENLENFKIFGMGVTEQEFKTWKQLQEK